MTFVIILQSILTLGHKFWRTIKLTHLIKLRKLLFSTIFAF